MIVNPEPSCRLLQTPREFGDATGMRFDGVCVTVYLMKYVRTFVLLCFVEIKSRAYGIHVFQLSMFLHETFL